MWIARDEIGNLRGFKIKPIRYECKWLSFDGIYTFLDSTKFPEITWESDPEWKRFVKRDWFNDAVFYKDFVMKICG